MKRRGGHPLRRAVSPPIQVVPRGLRFIAASDGPWLVHCSHGKDRTGFLCAILECLAGADADAVVADYMESYVNLYHLVPGSEQYELIAQSNIIQELQDAFGLADITADGVDLAEAARTYLLESGLEEEEIAAVLEKLSKGDGKMARIEADKRPGTQGTWQ